MRKYDLSQLQEYELGSPFWAGTENRMWVDDCKEAQDLFFEDLMATDPGKQYAAFRTSATDEQLFGYYRSSRFYGNEISVRNMAQALREMLISKSFVLPEVAEVVDNRPRGKDGRYLTEAQVAWGEMLRFSQAASAREVEARKKVDPAYAKFVAHQLRLEMKSTPIGDAVTPVGQTETFKPASQALKDFAALLRVTHSEKLHPVDGKITLGGDTVTWEQFTTLVGACREKHLL
jgi:hypothetical protein